MHLVVIGLNHKTAPVDIRERLAVPESGLEDALARLKMCGCVSECCLVSTCNRTEMYAVTNSREDDAVLVGYLSAVTDTPSQEFSAHLYSHAGHKAVSHLFRVAAGLDSMMLGEAQILGQVKTAYCVAGDCDCTGTVLNTLFQQALAVGKRARAETDIARGAFSVGYAAVELATSIFGELIGRSVLIVGAGKMSEITARRIIGNGAASVIVANRTLSKARELASDLGGEAIPFDRVHEAMIGSDIVITSTGSREALFTRDDIARIMRSRRERPIFLIDIAVPRDIEGDAGVLDNVFLYNIDDLEKLVEQSAVERRRQEVQIRELGERLTLVRDQSYRDVLTLATLSLLVLVGATIIVPERVLRPLKRLTALVRQAEGGNLRVAQAQVTPDEIGELAVRLNAVLGELGHFDELKRAKISSLAAQRNELIELLDMPAAVVDREGRVLHLSVRFCQSLGLDGNVMADRDLAARLELQGTPLSELLRGETASGVRQLEVTIQGRSYLATVRSHWPDDPVLGFRLLLLEPR